MITEIEFAAENYKYISESTDGSKSIPKLNKVNIFVGANNSGKSRFIRNILTENYQKSPSEVNPSQEKATYNNIIDRLQRDLKAILINNNLHTSIMGELTNRLNIVQATEHKKNINTLFQLKEVIDQFQSKPSISKELNGIFKQQVKKFGDDYYRYIFFKDYKAVYIPMIRGLRPLIKVEPKNIGDKATPYSDYNCFEERTIYDHFIHKDAKETYINNARQTGEVLLYTKYFTDRYNFDIFTGLDLYSEVKNMLLGTHNDRQFVRDYEDFLSERFFDKESITLIPRIKDDVLYIKIGEHEERPIYDLGDGLQTIIIATFPLFKYKSEKLLLFIEEPELTLHPGMQRKLLDTYCYEAENTQVFLTTHSNHFLDLTLDFNNKCSIYSFERKSDKEFLINNVTPNKRVLDLLGVRSSSVFLSNCVVWVEGISDRLYIRKFLELYKNNLEEHNKKLEEQKKDKKEFKSIFEEDKHYSIVEYGGGNITHFNFFESDPDELTINIESIAKNNFIVTDNNGKDYKGRIKNSEDKETKRLKTFRKRLGDSFFAEHIEIENLIPFEVYKKYFEKLDDVPQRNWVYDDSKGDEEKFNSELNEKHIGSLIRKYFVKLKDSNSKPKNYDNKDISCIGQKKGDVATLLTKIMDKEDFAFGDLPNTTKALTKKLYKFIESNNSQ